MAGPTTAFTVTGTSSGSGGAGTVTQVTGVPNQITVATPTSTPVVGLDPFILNQLEELNLAIHENAPASVSGARNLLINGSGRIAQRGTSGTASFALATAVTRFVDDMWQISTAGTPVTVTQVSGPEGIPATGIQIQRTANSTAVDTIQYGQTLTPDVTSSTWNNLLTFSFEAQALANFSGTLNVQIIGGTTSNAVSYLGTGFTNPVVLAQKDITLTQEFASYSLSLDTALAAIYSQLYLGFSWTPAGQAGALDGFVVAKRLLNTGTEAQTFNYPSLMQELNDCLPFYWKTNDLNVAPGPDGAGAINLPSTLSAVVNFYYGGEGGSTVGATPNPGRLYLPYPRPMYFTPTATFYGVGAANVMYAGSISTKAVTVINNTFNIDPYYQTTSSGTNHTVHLAFDASPV